jgi:hypothetical protein
MYKFVYPSVWCAYIRPCCLHVCLSLSVTICLFVYHYLSESVCLCLPSVCLSVCLATCLVACLPECVCLLACLTNALYIYFACLPMACISFCMSYYCLYFFSPAYCQYIFLRACRSECAITCKLANLFALACLPIWFSACLTTLLVLFSACLLFCKLMQMLLISATDMTCHVLIDIRYCLGQIGVS